MHDATLLSIRIRPLTLAELLMLRFLSRVEGCPTALFRAVARLRFLRHTLGTSLGLRAARGLAVAEAATLFLLVECSAESAEQLRLKAVLIRTFLESASSGNAGMMFTAGLQADASRLGVLVGATPPQDIVIPAIH